MISAGRYLAVRYLRGGRLWPELDCWGLYRQIVFDRTGIELAEFRGLELAGDIASAARAEAAGSDWLPVAPGTERECDAVLMKTVVRSGGAFAVLPMHIGCVVEPGRMLDIEGDAGVLDRAFRDTAARRARPEVANRVIGIFRPLALARAPA